MSKDNSIIWWGILIGVIFMAIFVYVLNIGDRNDNINTRELGKILCKEHGLEYDHREEVTIPNFKGWGSSVVPKIYCKSAWEEPVVDGIVVMMR